MWLGLYFKNVAVGSTDHVLHERITHMAYAYSDQLNWPNPHTLVLEIERSHRLHQTPQLLIADLFIHLEPLEIMVQSGIAPNPVAAALMAQYQIKCWDQNSLVECLNEWPIEQLDIDRKTQCALMSCGIHTLGELKQQPNSQRLRRFGPKLQRHIECLYGELAMPLEHWQPTEDYYQRIDLIDPVTHTSRLQRHLEKALIDLERWLIERDRALTHLNIRCKHERSRDPCLPDVVIHIGLAQPGFNQAHLKELVALKLEALVLKKPLITLIVQSHSTTKHRPPQFDLLSGHNQDQTWSDLLDCLQTKLGHHTIASLKPHAHHQPEKSWSWASANQTQPNTDHRPRPTWLLNEPAPCDRSQLLLEHGPERIETGWWEEHSVQRDYWIAYEPNGRRVWAFHEHSPRIGWFVHGIFG